MAKIHKFNIHGGSFQNPERPGKMLWPDHLHLTLSRFHAKQLINQMLGWLFDESESAKKEETFYLVGELQSEE